MALIKLLVVRMLFLSPFPSRPLYGGAVVRNHYLARFLARHHSVWASFCGRDGGEEFCGELPLKKPGLSALFDPWFLVRAYRLLKKQNIELIVSSSLIAGFHGALLKRLTGLPFWMDEHNVEWHCSKRYGHRFWWLIYLLEAFILKQADHITCVSEQDKKRFIDHFRLPADKLEVAPNGVDYAKLSAMEPGPPAARKHRKVLFFGVLDYPPNREAVELLARQIAPKLPADIEVLVAGVGGEDLAARFQGLTFLGFVDDIHKLIKDCDGLIVPLLAGGGTRMKILETVACGRAVVSTTCGAEGLDLAALGETLTLTDNFEEMVTWICDLKIAEQVQVPAAFLELYDWDKIWQNKAPL